MGTTVAALLRLSVSVSPSRTRLTTVVDGLDAPGFFGQPRCAINVSEKAALSSDFFEFEPWGLREQASMTRE